MTREEAHEFLYSIAGDLGFTDVENYTCKDGEKMHEAIKALEQEPTYYPPCIDCHKKMDEIRRTYDKLKEQEPCEDCISREQLVRELNAQMAVDAITKEVAIDVLEHLPPVTPKPKTGHWMIKDDYETSPYFVCSQCGEVSCCKGNFCPDCGADMRGEK